MKKEFQILTGKFNGSAKLIDEKVVGTIKADEKLLHDLMVLVKKGEKSIISARFEPKYGYKEVE